MPNTDSYVTISQYIKDLLANNTTLGLQDVWYGDQQLVPRVPAAAVEPGTLRRSLGGVSPGGVTENYIAVYVMVYHAGIKDTQTTKKECDEHAEKIITALHADLTMGGLVIHGFCTEVDPGYATRGGELFFATRIQWEGLTKTRLQ